MCTWHGIYLVAQVLVNTDETKYLITWKRNRELWFTTRSSDCFCDWKEAIMQLVFFWECLSLGRETQIRHWFPQSINLKIWQMNYMLRDVQSFRFLLICTYYWQKERCMWLNIWIKGLVRNYGYYKFLVVTKNNMNVKSVTNSKCLGW